jgi:hypothetical protein
MGLYLELDPSIVRDVIRVVENYKNQAVLDAKDNNKAIKPMPPSPSPSTSTGGLFTKRK